MLLLVLFSMPYILGTLFVLTFLLVDAAFHAAQVSRQVDLILRSSASGTPQRSSCFGASLQWYYFCVGIIGHDSTWPFLYINVLCLEARRQIYTVSYVQFSVLYSEWFAFRCNAILESLPLMLMCKKKKDGTVYTG